MLFSGYISLFYLWRNQIPNTPMEPEKIEQSIFTAWKQQRQEAEYDQSEETERLALKNENGLYTRNPVTVIIEILLQLLRILLSSHWNARISPLACTHGSNHVLRELITADTRKKSIFLLSPGLAKNENLLERQIDWYIFIKPVHCNTNGLKA